ncbi:MAG TPA: hypothetical protein VGZ93_06420 [Candidatus Methylacidiphilales bacterium]|jgi:hypothetical protein|nr:hypothetical protein [Candidatus Methylacidiphilales bacterium]
MNQEQKYHWDLLENAVNTRYEYPENRFKGRGIVICGGGVKYYTCAWICIHMLRYLGCRLPIQLWHLGPKEMHDGMRRLIEPLDVECIDGLTVAKEYPARILGGWEIKPYSIIHSRFEEVLSLDADNVCVRNPEYLFDTPEYKAHGAIFWPDYGRLSRDKTIWDICGVKYRDEPEFESGQIFVNKRQCWKALQITMHMNEHSDYYYRHMHGDKETFHMAFRRIDQPYAMTDKWIYGLEVGTMCQHDFEGNRLFQHRTRPKWDLFEKNPRIKEFIHEDQCFAYLEKLQTLWVSNLCGVARFSTKIAKSPRELAIAKKLMDGEFLYDRVGYDLRPMSFLTDGRIGGGAADHEIFWDVKEEKGKMTLIISCEEVTTCSLVQDAKGIWNGQWTRFEKMPVRLVYKRRLKNVTMCSD